MAPSLITIDVGMQTSCHHWGWVNSACSGRIIPRRPPHPCASGIIHSVLRALLIFPRTGSFGLTISCSINSFLMNRGGLRRNPLGNLKDLLITPVKSPAAVW